MCEKPCQSFWKYDTSKPDQRWQLPWIQKKKEKNSAVICVLGSEGEKPADMQNEEAGWGHMLIQQVYAWHRKFKNQV